MADQQQPPPPPPPPGGWQQPPPGGWQQPPAPKKRPRWPWIVGGVVVVLIAIAAIAGGGADENDDGPTLAENTTTEDPSPSPPPEQEPTLPPTTTAPQPEQFVVGDRVETSEGNFIQVYAYEQPVTPENEFITPRDGYEFAAIDVEACAGPSPDTTGTRSINPFEFVAHMPDNTRQEADIPAREPALNHTNLPNPGDCARGWVTFQIPAGVRPVYVERGGMFGGGDTIRWNIG